MGPGLFAEHFVAFQARLINLAEGISCSPHAHVFHQAQVAHLVADQRIREDVRGLLVVGFDAPEKQEDSFTVCNKMSY